MEVSSISEYNRRYIHNLVVPSTLILDLVSVVGIYGHICLIYATLRFRYLQSSCNILIALLALADLIHQLGHFAYGYVVYTGITFITQRYRNVSATSRSKICYIFGMNLFPIISSLVVAVVGYIQMVERAETEVLCLISAFFTGKYEYLWYSFDLFLATSSLIVYMINWIIVWKRSNGAHGVRKTLKPMTIILFLTFFGWFLLMVMMIIITSRKGSTNIKTGYASYAGIGVNVTISANYFVYKYFSSDYKKAFRELWGRKKSDVSTVHWSSR